MSMPAPELVQIGPWEMSIKRAATFPSIIEELGLSMEQAIERFGARTEGWRVFQSALAEVQRANRVGQPISDNQYFWLFRAAAVIDSTPTKGAIDEALRAAFAPKLVAMLTDRASADSLACSELQSSIEGWCQMVGVEVPPAPREENGAGAQNGSSSVEFPAG